MGLSGMEAETAGVGSSFLRSARGEMFETTETQL
jgi:hypothetical protein